VQRDDDRTGPAVSLERRMLDAERRAREIAENAQAEAEAAREEAVRAQEEAERAQRLETQARERLQVLVEAGVAMAASLETRSVLAAATAAAARRVCDYSVAFVVDREGRVEAAVGAHRDPTRFGMVERMASAHLPDREDPDSIVADVLKTGEPALIPHLSPEQMERMMAPGEQLELARSLGLASLIAAPLAARGRTLGVLVLVRDDPSTPFVEEDPSPSTTRGSTRNASTSRRRCGGASCHRSCRGSRVWRSPRATSPPLRGRRSAAISTTSSRPHPDVGSP
jgi:hypothetical protein